ncbi:hypothetical protein AMES_6819 [Amycolatopsis mediterranei S699]|uniref:Uncharacterized protein n=2 Tax=Amycolatopsis mediterranei TaxID=33910 RepID=A0A0H3DCG1_AMYMU|nr:conserved hypothetical protein [Amycolatopsis mediterranei U32]AFO80354.1 hypothetical protein AMES_6819 [Amycolatopsis mediterranei S699]AGT87482.1 hypothetical protein B737_6819 [Amycolatopsis mediterranei RB]KDO03861.1 hypothetical protein DV26_45075 [Amycolatopsis mediterranei]KDU94249.1 hypothetical protein DV36_02570 [Amycolatopsis mediterranei]
MDVPPLHLMTTGSSSGGIRRLAGRYLPKASATSRHRPAPKLGRGWIKPPSAATTVSREVETEAREERWNTMDIERTVLVAVHTITSLIRLEDIVLPLEDDPRVQLVYTQVPDQFGEGVETRLRDMEVRVLSWGDATRRKFDLVVAASLHRLGDLPATARFAAPHGAGYNKLWPAWAWPGLKDDRPVYGLDRASLLDDDGQPIVDALLLPHPAHLSTLSRQCPEAVPYAVVAGDPAYDRLLVCREHREHYRERLGIREAQTLVAVSSTWGPRSLLAMNRDLPRRLASELPANHRVIATVHPAVWAQHGARQVRNRFREAHAAGLDVVDTYEDWRGLLAAADFLVADHGSLSAYAAGAGIPVLLSHFADSEVDPDSIVAELARHSPLLDPQAPLVGQLTAAREAQPAQWRAVHDRLAARQGVSAEIVRETLYRKLSLTELPHPARWPLVPPPKLVRDDRRGP